MVRYDAADADELRWARVESWKDAGHAVIRDTGELASGVRLGPPVAIETRFIADWGIWVDGSGVVEGAATEDAGPPSLVAIQAGCAILVHQAVAP